MRQWYETASDLEAEKVVSEYVGNLSSQPVCTNWFQTNGLAYMASIAMRKLPTFTYKLDWCLTRGMEITAWAELKCRKVVVNQYPDIMMSVHKYVAGCELMERTGVPFIFFVAFMDNLGFHVVDPARHYRLEYSGRTAKTRDANDIEPVVFFPVNEFYLFNVVVQTTANTAG